MLCKQWKYESTKSTNGVAKCIGDLQRNVRFIY